MLSILLRLLHFWPYLDKDSPSAHRKIWRALDSCDELSLGLMVAFAYLKRFTMDHFIGRSLRDSIMIPMMGYRL